ncbi:Branched-chain-amino-acid transaminase [Bertholletia excelsa]
MTQKVAFLHSLVRSSGSVKQYLQVGGYYASRAASSLQAAREPSACCGSEDEYPEIGWDNLGFGITPTDYMYVTKCFKDGSFAQGQLSRYGNLELPPSAGVLNYAQGLYEGLKAYKREDGRLFLFRPEQNAIRMQIGAERLCMPSPSVEQFIDAVKQTVLANKRWIPPLEKGSLYIRPLLLGTGSVLGLAPAPEYTFVVFTTPVGNYFKEGLKPLNLYIEDEYHRATRGGVGGVKSITNYSPAIKPLMRARSRGFSDVLYLDSVDKKNLEEVTACNIFMLKGNIVVTPPTCGNILPGVTRKTIIDIAREKGYQVEERFVSVDELLDADEVFCTGTAVGVLPVGSVTYLDKRIEYKMEGRLISQELYSTMIGLQSGRVEDSKGWFLEIS